MSKACVKCGAQLPDETKFCTECGASQPVVHKCPKCGKVVDEDAVFCTECGTKIKGAAAAVAGQMGAAQGRSKGKVIGIIVGVIIIILAAAGFLLSRDNSGSSSVEVVKSQTVIEDYIRDQGTAEQKYKNKKIKITGKLIAKNQFHNSSNFALALYTKTVGGKSYTLLVDIPADKAAEANKVKIGDFVTAQGICVGIVKQDRPTDISVQIQCEKIN